MVKVHGITHGIAWSADVAVDNGLQWVVGYTLHTDEHIRYGFLIPLLRELYKEALDKAKGESCS